MTFPEDTLMATPEMAVKLAPAPLLDGEAFGRCLAGGRAGWILHDRDLPQFRAAVREMLPLVAHAGLYEGDSLSLAALRAFGVPILYPWDVQSTGDLTLIAHAIAEMALTPVIVYHDMPAEEQPYFQPSDELIEAFLFPPEDAIFTQNPAETVLFTENRRNIPATFSLDDPLLVGARKSDDLETNRLAARRQYFHGELEATTHSILERFSSLTEREYASFLTFSQSSASHAVVCHGTVSIPVRECAEAFATPISVIQRILELPVPDDKLLDSLSALEKVLQLAPVDTIAPPPLPIPPSKLRTAVYGTVSMKDIGGAFTWLVEDESEIRQGYLGIDFLPNAGSSPKARIRREKLLDNFPEAKKWTIPKLQTDTSDGAPVRSNEANVHLRREEHLPVGLQYQPENDLPTADIHRFNERTQDGTCADPFAAMNLLPALSGLLRNHSADREEIPQWNAEACTGCGKCWTYCPEAAVNAISVPLLDCFETAILKIEKDGKVTDHLRGAVRMLEPKVKASIKTAGTSAEVSAILRQTIEEAAASAEEALKEEYTWLSEALEGVPLANVDVTQYPFHGNALLALSINPESCTGCMKCVQLCSDDAIGAVPSTPEIEATFAAENRFLCALPNKKAPLGAGLEAILLDRDARELVLGGNTGAATSDKVVLRWIAAIQHNRCRDAQIACQKELQKLADKLEVYIHQQLASLLNLWDREQLQDAITDLTGLKLNTVGLSEVLEVLSDRLEADIEPVVTMNKLLVDLQKHIKTHNNTQSIGCVVSDNSRITRDATYPFNPFAFPWINVAPESIADSASGIQQQQEALSAASTDIQREVAGLLNADEDHVPPPAQPALLCVLDDTCSPDQQMSAVMYLIRQGKPVKILLLTSKPAFPEEGEAVQEPAFMAMMQQNAYVLQSSLNHPEHCLEGIRTGLSFPGPAFFHIFAPQGDRAECDRMVATRKQVLLSFTPGTSLAEGLDLSLNPDLHADWAEMPLDGDMHPITPGEIMAQHQDLEAISAAEEFEHWVHVSAYLDLEADIKTQSRPYVWGMDSENHPVRYIATPAIIDATRKQRVFWRTLSGLKQGITVTDAAPVTEDVPPEVIESEGLPAVDAPTDVVAVEPFTVPADTEAEGFVVAPWIDTPKCTTCEECVKINPEMFVYDDKKKAHINDLSAGTYKQLVRAAEKCTEKILFPGYPADKEAKGVAKLIKRAAKIMPMPYPDEGGTAVEEPPATPPAEEPAAETAPPPAAAGDFPEDYVAPWIDSPKCTTCEECIKINPEMFAYDSKKKAYFKDLEAGTYKQIVRAAEKCTEKIIHPGYPEDRTIKGVEKLMKRASRFMP